jgi:hypothetical protein
MATDLRQAFAKIRKDDDLARKFTEDPTGTLESLGVETANLKVKKNDNQYTISAGRGGGAAASAASFCPSVGCVVCTDIG